MFSFKRQEQKGTIDNKTVSAKEDSVLHTNTATIRQKNTLVFLAPPMKKNVLKDGVNVANQN